MASRTAHDLVALHHALGVHPRGLDDLLRLAFGLRQELAAFLEQPTRPLQLLGQVLERVVDERQQIVTVHSRRRRERNRAGALEELAHAEKCTFGVFGTCFTVDHSGSP